MCIRDEKCFSFYLLQGNPIMIDVKHTSAHYLDKCKQIIASKSTIVTIISLIFAVIMAGSALLFVIKLHTYSILLHNSGSLLTPVFIILIVANVFMMVVSMAISISCCSCIRPLWIIICISAFVIVSSITWLWISI